MAIISAKLFDAPSNDSGISIALGEARGKQFIRLGFMERGQIEHFGKAFEDGQDYMLVVIDDAKPHLVAFKITDRDDPNALPLKSGMKGSFNVKLFPWCSVPKGIVRVRQMDVTSTDKARGVVTCCLPDWARPPARKIGQGKSIMGE